MFQRLFAFFVVFTLVSTAMAQTSIKVEQPIQATGGQLTDTLDNGTVVTLDLSTDDVEQENAEVDSRFDDDLDAGWEGDPADQNELHMGLRFRGLNIPQGATIDSAYILLHAHEGKSAADVANLTIFAEATGNAPTFDETNFSDMYLVTDRPRTTASARWVVAEDWVIWQPYKTADLTAVVQEVVNRPDWAWGNAMAFLFIAENQGPSTVENAREFTSFENIADPDDQDPNGNPGDGRNWPERRPRLVVYFQGNIGVAEVQPVKMKAYPNPVVNGRVNLDLDSDQPAQVEIFDLTGNKVRSFEVEDQSNVLELGDLTSGVYLFQVSQNNETFSQKLIVK